MALPRASFSNIMAIKPTTVIAIGASDKSTPDDDMQGVKIPTPDGFEWPDDADPKEGETFMCVVTQDADGGLWLKELDGKPLSESEEDEPKLDDEAAEEKPAKSDMVSQFKSLMNGK